MTGAVDVMARGAIEVGERDGGSAASRFSRGSGRGRGARVKCVVWGHAAFPKGKAVGEVLRQLEAEEKASPLVRWRYIRQALNGLPS